MSKKKRIFLLMKIFLITLGIIVPALVLISNSVLNSDKYAANNGKIMIDNKSLELAIVSNKIHIDKNWSDAKIAGICTGEGTPLNPYIIEDLVIDGENSSCIKIKNSNVHFKIKNCTLYNAGFGAIYLYNVSNGQIIDNDCSSAVTGIFLRYGYYNTISGNTANNNDQSGIDIMNSHNNTVSGNTANNNHVIGIILDYSDNNTISGNTANENRWGLWLFLSDYNIISDNTLRGNTYCIHEDSCEGNIFQNNDCGGEIPGYNILFLLGILSLAVVIILRRKLKKLNNFKTLAG